MPRDARYTGLAIRVGAVVDEHRGPWSRRRFVQGGGVAGLGLLAGCGRWPWRGQSPPRLPRIGVLTSYLPGADAFRQALQEYGHLEGRDVTVDVRFSAGREAELAAELSQLPVDIIVAAGDPDIFAARRVTDTIPIVMTSPADPVGAGHVASLARPGGNVTGVAGLNRQLNGKRLELLTAVVADLTLDLVGCTSRRRAAQRRLRIPRDWSGG